uniref:Uncharacterized protein n=1 Tax=viral metagenome TaxID=1070528 RepID=A0A6M3K3N0_9ZZZZ
MKTKDVKMRNWMIILGTGFAVGLSYYLFVVKGLGRAYVAPDNGTGNGNETGTGTGTGMGNGGYGLGDYGNNCPEYPIGKYSGYVSHGKSCEKPYVKIIQQYLNMKSYPPLVMLVVDGLFGPKTEDRLYILLGTRTIDESNMKMMSQVVQIDYVTL